jgi:aminoglycoside 6'-N-acetyltransferase I
MTPELQTFLERYRDAFNALDGDAVAALYAEPSGISQGGAWTPWPDRAAVAINMRALCAMYRERGFVRAAFDVTQVLPLGRHDAVVDVAWRIDWALGAEPWRFATAYHLMRSTASWRVRHCIAHEEAGLWQGADSSPLRAAREPASPIGIDRLNDAHDADWLRLRRALWPDGDVAEHQAEMASQVAEPTRFAQFVARDGQGQPLGLAEVSLRHDYVPGTQTSPVAFLEGLYVEPTSRQHGIARLLVAASEAWGASRGCRELASDTPLDNTLSQRVHQRLGFAESERILCFVKPLKVPGEGA